MTFLAGDKMFDCAQDQVDALEAEGCEYIICLGHLGIDAESTGNRSIDLLEKVEGIGESAAILLSLVSRLSRKARIADASQETILNSSERAGAYLLERFAGERRELVFLLCLDRKGRLLACKRLAEGDVASADLNIRKVVEMALLTSASAVILAHNHPSGVAVPSSSDEAATRQVAEALRTIGVRLVDHIVVADRDFVSMADSGDLLG